jgi:hypothetical protein
METKEKDIKLCKDCKHCKPSTTWLFKKVDYKTAKCTKHKLLDVVTGERKTNEYDCSLLRESYLPHSCGYEAEFFEAKNGN